MTPSAIREIKKARELAMAQFVKDMAIHDMASIQKEVFTDIVDLASKRSRFSANSVEKEIERISASLFDPSIWNLATYGNANADNVDPIVALARKVMQSESGKEKYTRVIGHFNEFSAITKSFVLNPPARSSSEADRLNRAKLQFEDIIPLSFSRAARMYNREQRNFDPETLVLQGGGEKGVGYAGVIDVLAATGKLDHIKYVGGTSAGALMGLPVALGFSSLEINDIVKQGRFAQFFSESTTLAKFTTGTSLRLKRLFGTLDPSKTPYLEGFNLTEFSKKFMVPALSEETGISQKKLKEMGDVELHQMISNERFNLDAVYKNARADFDSMLISEGRNVEVGVLQFSGLPGRPESLQAAITSVRSLRGPLHPEKDLIESFIADIIESGVSRYIDNNPNSRMAHILDDKEKIRSMNFSDLQGLAQETDHKSFKEFGVAVTRSHIFRLTWIPRAYEKTMNSIKSVLGNKDQDKGYGPKDSNTSFEPVFVRSGGENSIDMPIKKAVRTSMNLPVLFGAISHEGGSYYDGGINNNYPHRMFLDKYDGNVAKAEERTIGFILSTIDSDMENATIENLVNVARDFIAVELENHPDTMVEKIKNAGNDFLYFSKDFGKNIVKGNFVDAGKQGLSVLKYPLKKTTGFLVDFIMSRNNSAVPSAQILANTGVINTGNVGTADFHLNQDDKNDLAEEGTRAALRMLSAESDGELMYSKGRLLSLIKAENQIMEKYGYDERINIPETSLLNPHALMDTLKELTNSEMGLASVMSGIMSEIKHDKENKFESGSSLMPG